MCGRFNTHDLTGQLLWLFGSLKVPPKLPPGRFNTAPTQEVTAIRTPHTGGREAAAFRWGLVPRWAKDLSLGVRMINARCETVAEKPSFRDAIAKRRCLVPMCGYYEWQGDKKARQPFYVHLEDKRPFAVAGIWERWRGTDGEVETVSLLTQEATERMARLHHRMPVMVPRERFDEWLNPDLRDPGLLVSFYNQGALDGLTWYAVDSVVNNARNDVPECIAPLDPLAAAIAATD